MEHIRRIAANPGPGTGSQWLLRLAIPIEPARWQGQERQDAWRFSDGKNGKDDLSAKERSSFYSRYGRFFFFFFGKSLPILPYFLHQISHFSGAKLTQAPCLHLRMTVFCNGCLLKREHCRQRENSRSPIALRNIVGVKIFVYCRVKDIVDRIKGEIQCSLRIAFLGKVSCGVKCLLAHKLYSHTVMRYQQLEWISLLEAI